MLITLVAWAYISFVCYGLGMLFIKCLRKICSSSETYFYGFSITCFAGLALAGSVAQLISLFTRLGSFSIQILFFLPAAGILFFSGQIRKIIQGLKKFVRSLPPAAVFLLGVTLLMILTMSVYPIQHPDTHAYHAQMIKWAEQYKVIPGLVHVNYLYGLQNNWFILCSLFSFSFAGTNALTFINSTIIVWLLIFFCEQIGKEVKKTRPSRYALLWLSLLAVNLWSYTQIRLTVTSASPDFIAALFILLTAYLCIRKEFLSKETELLVIFLCFFTFTIKLSAIPVILLPVYMLYPFKRIKTACFIIFFSFVIIPFLTRNIITSGHLFFPSAFLDIIHADWKYDTNKLDNINSYILYFARSHDTENVSQSLNTVHPYWMQKWWIDLSVADKFIIIVQFFSAGVLVLNFRSIVAEQPLKKIWIALSLIGIIFWFVKAPDPRFGTGFLLLFPSLIFSGKFSALKSIKKIKYKSAMAGMCLLWGLIITLYTSYRFINFFQPEELIYPGGIVTHVNPVYYKEINTTIPLGDHTGDNLYIIPAGKAAPNFSFRGERTEDGFKAKK